MTVTRRTLPVLAVAALALVACVPQGPDPQEYLPATMVKALEHREEAGAFPVWLDDLGEDDPDLGVVSFGQGQDGDVLCISLTTAGSERHTVYSDDPETVVEGGCDADRL